MIVVFIFFSSRPFFRSISCSFDIVSRNVRKAGYDRFLSAAYALVTTCWYAYVFFFNFFIVWTNDDDDDDDVGGYK